MIPTKHKNVIKTINERLQGLDIDWAITGSLGFALHGLDVTVRDIDIQTDKNGVYLIEQVFSSYIRKKVEFIGMDSEAGQSYFGQLNIDGIGIDIIGGLQKRMSDGTWENPVDVRQHREFVDCDGVKLPVLNLEYEESTYREVWRRIRKADMIRDWLAGHGISRTRPRR